MLRGKGGVVAGVMLAGLVGSAGAQFHRSDRSSAEVGINLVQAPVPAPLLTGRRRSSLMSWAM